MKTLRTLKILSLATIMIFAYSCKKKKGCTDPVADNYDFDAEKDDGSCIYSTPAGSSEEDNSVYTLTDVSSNTVLTAKNIEVCSDVYVSAGLTIPAGAVVSFCEGASIIVKSSGYLKADGTSADPIVFKGATSTKGFWDGIRIESNNPNNVFNYVTFRDAGGYWYFDDAGIFVANSAMLNITNSAIDNCLDEGLFFDNDAIMGSFSNNVFSNCVTGLSLPSRMVGSIDSNSDYNHNSTNSNDFIEARESTIGVNTTWPKTNTPILNQGTTLDAGLTISPGCVVLNEQNKGFLVNSGGFFNCVGTASEPIQIKGRYSTSAYWSGISIRSNNPNNVIKYTTVSDGGSYWYYEYAGIQINGGRLDIDYSTVSNSNSYGIYVHNNSTLYTGGVAQTTVAGVETTNTFINNGTGPNANCTNGCKVYFQP
jgi:hypothetical protein